MSNVPNRETFESIYAGKAPWDIGKPQPAFVEVADRVTGAVLDAGCSTGENALFFAGRGHPVPRMRTRSSGGRISCGRSGTSSD